MYTIYELFFLYQRWGAAKIQARFNVILKWLSIIPEKISLSSVLAKSYFRNDKIELNIIGWKKVYWLY